MKRILVILMAMSVTASGLWAQIDVHSHAITASYMKFLQAHVSHHHPSAQAVGCE